MTVEGSAPPTLFIITSVLLLLSLITFLPESDSNKNTVDTFIYDDDENNKYKNIQRQQQQQQYHHHQQHQQQQQQYQNINNNYDFENNNYTNVHYNSNNKTNNNNNNTFLNKIKKIFTFLNKNNNSLPSFEVQTTTPSQSQSQSLQQQNSNCCSCNNNNNNNNNNNDYNTEELIEIIHSERNNRLIVEKILEEKEATLESIKNEINQKDEFQKKLLLLATLEINKKKQAQNQLNEISDQIYVLLETISKQTVLNNNNQYNNNENNNSMLISVDNNLVEQFESISNILKTIQETNNGSDSSSNSSSNSNSLNNSTSYNVQTNGDYSNSEESLYLGLVKISKSGLPFSFSDIIS